MAIARTHRALYTSLAAAAALSVPVGRAAAAVSVEIASVKDSYLPAEPVFLDVTLRNGGTSGTELVSPEAAVENQLLSVFIASGSEPPHRYDPGFVGDPGRMPRKLGPGESITLRQLVLFDHPRRDFALAKPGVYRIHVAYHRLGALPDVTSNTIEVTVRPAEGPAAQAHELFASKPVAQLILGIDESPAAVVALEGVMTRHRDTVYGRYAQFYLARRQAHEHFARKASPDAAARLYRDLLARDPAFPLAGEAHLALGRALASAQRFDEARESLARARAQSRLTNVVEGANRALQSLPSVRPPR